MKKSKFTIASILGMTAGTLIILTGILTALKITPPIALTGLEIGLGIWRIFAGLIILIGAYLIPKNKLGAIIVIVMGFFEVFVFSVEKDYTLLTIAPFLAILAGIIGIVKKKSFYR